MAVTLCPIALAVGCRKCPIFKVCPVKGIIGDQRSAARGACDGQAPANRKRAEGEAPPRAKRKGGRPRRRNR